MKNRKSVLGTSFAAFISLSAPALAVNDCASLPNHASLKAALIFAVGVEGSGGLNNEMWATIVDRAGFVCAVAFSGTNVDDQWPGSRVISAQKANTANAFSLDGLTLSTANLYAAVQPGGSLFGLQESNPVDPEVAYAGDKNTDGTAADGMVGKRVGGVNVFGGGLGLYSEGVGVVGGVGASGDTSCADHNIAWHIRNRLHLDHLANVLGPAGLFNNDPTRPDNIIFDLKTVHDISKSGFGHPTCLNTSDLDQLPAVR